MRIAVLYRTYNGSNTKSRPPWFDREAALRSLQSAAAIAGVPVSVTFVVDGDMPPELAQAVRPQDSMVTIDGGSPAKSFRACVGVAVDLAATCEPGTIFWFAEDDYAYRADSFAQIADAAVTFQDADYFALYVPDEPPWHEDHPSQPFRALGAAERRQGIVGEERWRRARETTSTFGVRAETLLADQGMLRFGSMVGAPFDAATWVALQGIRPFSYRHLLCDLDGYWSLRGAGKIVAKPLMRVALNLASLTRVRTPRVLMAPERDLAMHLETEMIPPGDGWENV